MPRPKLRPEDRQRSDKACSACKASKKRCDSQLPCGPCVRRDRATSCVYADIDRRRRPRARTHPRNHFTGQSGTSFPTTVLHATNEYDDRSMVESLDLISIARPRTSDPSNSRDSGRLLPIREPLPTGSTRGKGYVDQSTSSSFLQFLRKTLRPYVGSVSFTDDERHHTMLEANISDTQSNRLDITPMEKYLLLESYFEATSGFLDLFTAGEIDKLIAEKSLLGSTTLLSPAQLEDAAALDAALAIGAQVKDPNAGSIRHADSYFCCARRAAFESMLTNPNLSMIRLFLLLAFYMLGACDRNAAAMYLGVAVKAAVVLGLHHSANYKNLHEDECSIRLRTWNSLRNVDILASFIFGKPKSLPVMGHGRVQTEISIEGSSQDSKSAFNAIIKGCSLLEVTVDKLSCGNMLHVPTAEGLLEQLRQWIQALPPTLRQFTFTSVDGTCLNPAQRQLLTGNLHISCVYYFGVMLITRPFLIAYLMSRLRGRAPDQLIDDPEAALDINIKNNTVSKLAQVCVSSAVCMANTCEKAMALNFRFGNMCLLKAWVFGAGLVLGFSRFAGEPRKDISDAFDGARGVLDRIAVTSPQARLYHEVLTNFSEAVNKYHSRVRGEVRRTVQHYIDQALVFNYPQDVDNAGQHYFGSSFRDMHTNIHTQTSGTSSNSFRNSVMLDTDPGVGAMEILMDMAGLGGTQDDWDSINIELAQNFVLDVEPFEKLFYSVE